MRRVAGLVAAPDALRDVPKEPDALIDGILPLGVMTLLAADPKAGKTTFGWHLVESVLTGTPFAGRPVHSPGPVLWIGSDAGWKHELRNRDAEKYPNLFFPDDETLRGLKSYASDRDAWRRAMTEIEAAIRVAGIRLVVIDHLLGFAIGEDGADKPEFIKPWMEAVSLVGEACNVATLVMIHNSKTGQIPHSYAILAIVRHILRLRRYKERRIVVTTKGNLYADSTLTFPFMSPEDYLFEVPAASDHVEVMTSESRPELGEPVLPSATKVKKVDGPSKADRTAAQLSAIRADLAAAPSDLSVLGQATWLRDERGYMDSLATLRRRIASL